MRLVNKFLKLLFFTLSVIFLSGCHAPPKIERGYDDFSKQHICSYENSKYLIFEWDRNVYLTLRKYEDEDYVRGLIKIYFLADKTGASIIAHPNITFDVYKNNNRVKSIKSESKTTDTESIFVPSPALGVPDTDHVNTLSQFQLSYDDFREIAYAEHIKIYISDEFDSIEGTITKSELEFFKEFDKKCIP